MLFVLAATVLQGTVAALLGESGSLGENLWYTLVAFLLAAGLANLRLATTPGTRSVPLREAVPINLLTALVFLCFYVSLAFVPGSVTTGVETAMGPLAAWVLTRRKGNVWLALAVLGAGVAFCLVRSASGTPLVDLAVGGALATVAGVGAAGIATESVRLSGLGHSPSAILACRYHLTYVLAGVGVAWHWAGNGAPTLDWPYLIVLSLLGVVAPLWLLQIGLTRTNPVAAMAIMSTLPVVSYLTEVLQGSVEVTWSLLLATAVVALAFFANRSASARQLPD
jgi:drug/metabolite transporter (DMT)-like permease